MKRRPFTALQRESFKEKSMSKSWKVEVLADNSGTWAGNALRFASRLAAKNYALDLSTRWTAVREYRIVEVDEPADEELS